MNNLLYYGISDKNGWLGFVNAASVTLATGNQGVPQAYSKYVNIKGNQNIWNGFDFKTNKPAANYKNQTLQAREVYSHFNGARYLSLYTNKGQLLGYIDESGVTVATGNQGLPQTYQKYVSVKGSHNIWNGFDFKTSKPAANYKNQTLQTREIYSHFNGSRYLSLYTNKGVLLGYIDETGVTVAPGNQGVPQAYSKYVSIRGHYNIWSGFDWKTSQLGSNYKNQTFEARESYTHFNGSTYLSLYNNKGALLGYINASGVNVAKGRQGVHQKYGKFVTLKGYYDIWDGFSFRTKKLGKDHKGKTYQARGIYHHFNGLRYLSLYDNKGNWLGYINEKGASLAKGRQGTYQSYNQLVRISSNRPIIWTNFGFKGKVSGNHKNKIYLAKGYYTHFNGSRYLSLYNNGKWVGYINESSTKKVRGAGNYLQTTREKLINSLNTNKNIYLRTPYKSLVTAPYQPERLMSPIGRPNGNPPAFNCTGFVARAVRDGGGNLNKVTNVTKGWGTSNNAYNWRDALVPRTDSVSFKTIDDLLKSGLAKKGDILYFEADFSRPGYDCHIGIFWGDTPTENKIWHSTGAKGNAITNIFSGTPYSKVMLIPMD